MMAHNTAKEYAHEVESGNRFEFGRNWHHFLANLSPQRIAAAEDSLRNMLGCERLDGRDFLDIGSGSGLFSLAARRLGARVYSFDCDPHSVACTREMQRRYFPGDPDWGIEQGSVLDTCYLTRLGRFDIVYSWGVLHHTGAMWKALENVIDVVRPGGVLFIAIYNDQGKKSQRWIAIKKLYNRLPSSLRLLVVLPSFWVLWWRRLVKDAVLGKPLRSLCADQPRGMSAWRDTIDWIGGYPFEVARPEEIFEFFRQRRFTLERLQTQNGNLGCNEFVFRRS